jgi:pimeloyl-ACP methyl ester carboxylesterase
VVKDRASQNGYETADFYVTALKLKRVSLLGHSMGAAVIWSYIELFGDTELSKLILIDQSPALDDFVPLNQITEEHFHSHFDVNLLAMLLAVKEAVKYMEKSGGCILNISSLSSTHPAAAAVLFCSENTGWITGECIRVSGGLV